MVPGPAHTEAWRGCGRACGFVIRCRTRREGETMDGAHLEESRPSEEEEGHAGASMPFAPTRRGDSRPSQGGAGHAGASTPCGPTRGGEPQKRGRSGKGLVLVKRPQTYTHIHHHHRHATTMTVTLVPRRPAHSRPFISPLKLKPTTILMNSSLSFTLLENANVSWSVAVLAQTGVCHRRCWRSVWRPLTSRRSCR